MHSWFRDLCEKRGRFLEAMVENEFREGIWRSTVEKYADPVHFVLELLQNAEDQEATQVAYNLEPGRVVFTHDGSPFTRDDVDAITGIGNTRKPDQANMIGRFGIGFKSVFLVTERPEIYSTLEGEPISFAVSDLVVPEPLEHDTELAPGQTKFVLPLDANRAETDLNRIAQRLEELGPEVLLFLRNISRLDWHRDGKSRSFVCVRGDDGIHTFSRREGNGQPFGDSTRYLVLSSDVDELEGDRRLEVSLAFRLSAKGELVPEPEPAPCYVYFETEDVTNLFFRVHAPFLLTDNRANVKRHNDENDLLIEKCGELLESALVTLRDRGLLTAGALAVLPNASDNLKQPWLRFQEVAVDSMKRYPLVPTDQAEHARAGDTLRGPARVRQTLDAKDLSYLRDDEDEYAWAAGVMASSREDRFLDLLELEEWGWDELIEAVNDRFKLWNSDPKGFHEWLRSHDDKWHQRFYGLLREAEKRAHWRTVAEECAAIVLTETGQYRTGSQAYFPSGTDSVDDGGAVVRRSLLSGDRGKGVREFLERLGVREIGEDERIEILLEQNYGKDSVDVEEKDHLDHMRRFLAWQKKGGDVDVFDDYPVFLVGDGTELAPASACYLDEPFQRTDLAVVYGAEGVEEPKYSPWKGYVKHFERPRFVEFALALGVQDRLQVEKRSVWHHPGWRAIMARFRNANQTHTGINSDYTIEHLDSLLEAGDKKISLCIWRAMSEAPKTALYARYRPNQAHQPDVRDSSLVIALRDAEWLPDSNGVFYRPCDLTEETLSADFVIDDKIGWLDAVQFGQAQIENQAAWEEREAQAASLGLSVAIVDKLQALPEEDRKRTVQKIEEFVQLASLPEFPEDEPPDPERRTRNVKTRAASQPSKKREIKQRTVRTTVRDAREQARQSLRASYTNEAGQLVCQCCRHEMPFRLADGSHYFEAVECVTDATKELVENFLALCPICAAKYKHANQDDAGAVRQKLVETENREIELTLASELCSIRFTGKHLLDLRAVLEDESD